MFLLSAGLFFKKKRTFSTTKKYRSTIRMSNGLDPDQDRRYQQTKKVVASMKAQPAVVLVLERLRRRCHGLKSHPTDLDLICYPGSGVVLDCIDS